MAESFPSTIATNILATIAILNSKKERFSWHIPDEIMDLNETLLKTKEDLLNAEEQQAQNRKLPECLAQLSDQLYDAEDVVGEVKCELENPSRDESWLREILNTLTCLSIPYVKKSKQLAEITKRFGEIAAAIKCKRDLSWNLILKEIPEHVSKLLNLQTLRLLGCSNLQKLPRDMQKITSLRYLEITAKEIGEWMQKLTSLRILVLQGCGSLNSLPYNMKDLKGLKKLVIRSCPKINLKMDLQGEDPNSSKTDSQSGDSNHWTDTLEYLRIEACPELKELPPWLASLKALKKLEILSCQELSSLPDGMQNLTNLREWKIKNCPTLSESYTKVLPKKSDVLEIQPDP
ncbi:hypothetical protein Pint_11960 [Pistacia integerrima]|uniref:Uncharacterized protein n=1 Tax=Pistacia integerrima TaxID=434235 RepID=A0ACC0XKQ6_9ROSI|nr:hypothetical protein Pint_11960 [Pistacia integerrima]